jgi:hypothetical protein
MAENHPSPVMSGAGAVSRKRRVAFAPVLKNSCHSAIDPIAAAHESLVYPRLSVT